MAEARTDIKNPRLYSLGSSFYDCYGHNFYLSYGSEQDISKERSFILKKHHLSTNSFLLKDNITNELAK
jgi:hypothetical protein